MLPAGSERSDHHMLMRDSLEGTEEVFVPTEPAEEQSWKNVLKNSPPGTLNYSALACAGAPFTLP